MNLGHFQFFLLPTPEVNHVSNTLVVYYSLTGHTRQIAETIAAAHDADLEVIEDTFNRDTALRSPRSAVEGLLALRSSITPPNYDPSE